MRDTVKLYATRPSISNLVVRGYWVRSRRYFGIGIYSLGNSDVVCRTAEALVSTAKLGVWPSVDGALCAYGYRCVARVACVARRGRASNSYDALWYPASVKWHLDPSLFWTQNVGAGVRRYCGAVDHDLAHDLEILVCQKSSGGVVDSVFVMGLVCDASQCRTLAVESHLALRIAGWAKTWVGKRGEMNT